MTTSSNNQNAVGTVYTCPMHPEIRSDKPGSCPKCGMFLVPEELKGAQADDTGCCKGESRAESGCCGGQAHDHGHEHSHGHEHGHGEGGCCGGQGKHAAG